MPELFARNPPPAVPPTEPWQRSLGQFLPGSGALSRAIRPVLDRFGRISIGPGGLGLNNTDIPWDDIVEVRLRPAREVLTEDAARRFAERIGQLPWLRFVPGRARLLGKLADTIAGAIGQTGPRTEIPTEIVRRGRLGSRHRVRVGFFALLVLAMVPETAQSIASVVDAERFVAADGTVTEDLPAARAKLKHGLWVWTPIALFWLVAAGVAGSVGYVVLLLMPFLLVSLAHSYGIDRLPWFVVYPLGLAQAAAFSLGAHWKWPFALLILLLVWGYEHVLDATVEIRAANGKRGDPELAHKRTTSLTLLSIAIDCSAAKMDVLLVVVALVAAVRLGRFFLVLGLGTVVFSLIMLVAKGDPAVFVGPIAFAWPRDVDVWFTVITFVGATWSWGRAAYRQWRAVV